MRKIIHNPDGHFKLEYYLDEDDVEYAKLLFQEFKVHPNYDGRKRVAIALKNQGCGSIAKCMAIATEASNQILGIQSYYLEE